LVESMPLVPANLAWGIAFGGAAAAAGLAPAVSIAMSAIAWSGTAQMAALGMQAQPLVAIFATSLLLSLRFVPMALVLGARLSDRPRWQRAILGCLIADASFALLARRHTDGAAYLAMTWVALYSTWLIGTAIGALAAPLLPAAVLSASDAVVAAIFAALTVEVSASHRAAAAALMGALIAVFAAWLLPIGAAVLLAAVIASAAALRLMR
jgi:predicted branched-subunit amino acid permease